MEMFSETGKSLVLCCFCPVCTHTFTHTSPEDGFAAQHYQTRVLCGAHCLCQENRTMNNHFSSFKAILIFFPDLAVAGTPGCELQGRLQQRVLRLHPFSPEELHPKDRVAMGGTGHPSGNVAEAGGLCSRLLCPTLSWGQRKSDCRAWSGSPVTPCLCSASRQGGVRGTHDKVRAWAASRLPDLLRTF